MLDIYIIFFCLFFFTFIPPFLCFIFSLFHAFLLLFFCLFFFTTFKSPFPLINPMLFISFAYIGFTLFLMSVTCRLKSCALVKSYISIHSYFYHEKCKKKKKCKKEKNYNFCEKLIECFHILNAILWQLGWHRIQEVLINGLFSWQFMWIFENNLTCRCIKFWIDR